MTERFKGFTLVELLVAMAILSITLITVFQLLGSSSKRSVVSASLFSAVNLSTKIRASLGEEMRLNPAFIEMTHEYPEMTDKAEVVDGRSWFFRWGRDRNAPFGIIDSNDGPAITPEDASLYSEFKPFQVSFNIQRLESAAKNKPESHLCETSIKVHWQDKGSQNRDYKIHSKLFSPGRATIPDGLLIDQKELNKLSREALFPEAVGMSLEAAADMNGCDRELARHAGRLSALMRALDTAISSITADISDLVKQRKILLVRPGRKLAETQIMIARKTEDGASLIYNVLAECGDSWDFLSKETDTARLGGIPYTPYTQAIKFYAALGPQIADWVHEAGIAYEWLLQPSIAANLTNRERDNAANKRLESFRLLQKLRPSPSISGEFAAFLRRETELVTGKNPHQMKFLSREEQLRKSPERYSVVFPNLGDILKRITVEILPNGKNSAELIARRSQGGQL